MEEANSFYKSINKDPLMNNKSNESNMQKPFTRIKMSFCFSLSFMIKCPYIIHEYQVLLLLLLLIVKNLTALSIFQY